MLRLTLFPITLCFAALLFSRVSANSFHLEGATEVSPQSARQQLDQVSPHFNVADPASTPFTPIADPIGQQSPEGNQQALPLYNCGGCQLIARSDSRQTKKEGLQCAKEVGAAVISDYKSTTGNTRYTLSHKRIVRIHSPSGSEDLIKQANFFDLAVVPDDKNQGFVKKDVACSNGLQGIARCYDCTKV